jgi:hypothetical protein
MSERMGVRVREKKKTIIKEMNCFISFRLIESTFQSLYGSILFQSAKTSTEIAARYRKIRNNQE